MRNRQIVGLLCSCTLVLLLATPAFAGGWAVVTIDELPQQLRAGEPISLGFTVRQHGQHPVNLEKVILTATQRPNGETLTFTAHQEGAIGHYVVEVMLPTAGTWDWSIQPDWFASMPMMPLTVLDETAVEASLSNTLPWLVIGSGAVVLGSAALLPCFTAQRARIFAGGLGLACVVGGLGWMGLGAQLTSVVAAQSPTNVTYGQALFMAKGCNSCHLHAEALNAWSTEMGPNLTDYQNTAEYLQVWLKDPQEIKPNTAMPNLLLKEYEIEALAAFLTQTQQ